MRIKKYVAKDFKTAIQRAKEEMGRDAIILYTRQIKKGGILGLFYPPRVEVTVAIDENLQVNTDRVRPEPVLSDKVNTELAAVADNAVELAPAQEDAVLVELHKMKNLMEDIKSRMYELELIKGMPEQVQVFYETLVKSHVDRDIALNMANNVVARLPKEDSGDVSWIRDVCIHTLQEALHPIQPIKLAPGHKGMKVFLVGPTGVGKTTTIAKLAANLTFIEGHEVALITLDTYRISAAEQLRTFAEIIGIPISVVFTPTDLMLAIEQYQEKDIIFVDTAGRSPYNDEHIQELQEFMEAAKPDETILVLSVTTDSSDQLSIYQKFEAIGVDKIVFTKLDETCKHGSILNALHEINKPLAYVTTGQNVPDDIEIPDSLRLAQMLLGGAEAL